LSTYAEHVIHTWYTAKECLNKMKIFNMLENLH